MEKIKLDIVSDNFDQYFLKACANLGHVEKSQIPTPILSRLLSASGKISQKSLDIIGFLGKAFILFKAFGKRIFILVEGNDSEGAMNVKDFVNYRTSTKEKNFGEGPARELVAHAHFIIGGRDLMDGFEYLNMLSASPAYHYLTRLKNGRKDSLSEWKTQREYVVNFLLTYESNKKKWIREYSLSMPEYLVLMYTYSGKEVFGSEIYNKALTNAHFAGGSKIRVALSLLQNKKYITKRGVSKGSTYKITPLGKHMVDEIIDRYAIKC